MSVGTVVLLGLWGFAVSWLAIPVIRRKFKPTGRRQLHHTHSKPVSRLGGLALALPFTVTAAVALLFLPLSPKQVHDGWVILLSSAAMFLVGFWDDLKPLGARKKLILQVLIASAVYASGLEITRIGDPIARESIPLGSWSYFVTVFWLVALTNLINLIDGVDGLAAGISLMVMGLLLFVGFGASATFPVVCAAVLCGALLGFLAYNFPPATIYLGDGGAYFLGFLAGILSLAHSQKGAVVAALISPLFVLALPIIDVTLAILRRGLKGLPVFRPDRRHLHHRLAQCGLSRTRIVLMCYGFSLFFLVLAVAVFLSNGTWLPLLFGAGCVVLLISAGSFDFSRSWFSIGKVLGNSQVVRKQTRYALAIQRWMELEAERSVLPEELWEDFALLCRKLGFVEVSLTTAESRKVWTSPSSVGGEAAFRRHFDLATGFQLDIAAREGFGSDEFEILSEIAAETWVKVTDRWQALNRVRFAFNPGAAGICRTSLTPANPILKTASTNSSSMAKAQGILVSNTIAPAA